MPMVVAPATIDDCLGPAGSRYFGEGFRRVGHRIRDVEVWPHPVDGVITARADLDYPTSWSTKSESSPPRPHLSTVDALVIAVQMAEAYLTYTGGLDVELRQRMWLRSFQMKAGTAAQERLTRVPVVGVRRGTRPAPEGVPALLSQFDFRVGTIELSCHIQHDGRRRVAPAEAWSDIDHLLGSCQDRHYGHGFKRRQQEITDITFDGASGSIRASVHVTEPDETGGAEHAGFSALYEPSLSLIDTTISMAQLAQALVYKLEGVDRAETGTFWMRGVGMSARTPYRPLADTFIGFSQVVKRNRVDGMGKSWRTFDLEGDLHEVHGSASVAFDAQTP